MIQERAQQLLRNCVLWMLLSALGIIMQEDSLNPFSSERPQQNSLHLINLFEIYPGVYGQSEKNSRKFEGTVSATGKFTENMKIFRANSMQKELFNLKFSYDIIVQ